MPVIVITEVNSITAIGDSADETAESFFSGKTSISYDDSIEDEKGRPIKTAVIDYSGKRYPDEACFIGKIAAKSLSDMCSRYFKENFQVEDLYFFLGLPFHQRPGISFDVCRMICTDLLVKTLEPYAGVIHVCFFRTGNASAFHGIQKAVMALEACPQSLCIVGGVDSLLSSDTISWLKEDRRLVSDGSNRQNGLFPSHAAGFFIMETENGAEKRCKKHLARIDSLCLATEPSSSVYEMPVKGEGLTEAIRNALENKNISASAIDSIFCDLNGEYHRFKEWGFADIRCFPHNAPQLFHPSDCMGDVGAAWVPVLAGMAIHGFKKGVSSKTAMVICSDDYGEKGAMILTEV